MNTPPSPDSPVLKRATLERARSRMPESIGQAQYGKRSVSLTLLSPPRSLSSTSSTSAKSDTRHILIPEVLDSALTYEFIGFTHDKATALYEQWWKLKPQTKQEYDFLDFAKLHIKSNTSGILDESDDWVGAMTQVGIHNGIQTALMASKHRQIRLTMSLADWLCTIIETNLRTLEQANDSVEAHIRFTDEGPSLRRGEGEPEEPPAVPREHIALYKSCAFNAFTDCFSEDGSVHLGKLMSKTPTDFAQSGGLYLTPQKWCALYYANALNDVCVTPDIRTLEIHVPLDYINTLNVWRLDYGDLWRELVWCSRRSEYYPKSWQKDHSRQELIIGPIAHGANKHFAKLKSWEKVTDKNVIMSEDGKEMSCQYVFMKARTMETLEEKVKGKSYLVKTFGDFKVIAHPWIDKRAGGST